MTRPFRLSVAVPAHNETSVLSELLRRRRSVLDHLTGGPRQIVFVDNGSSHATFDILEEAARSAPRILALSASRNFWHQAAITAALDHVTGSPVPVMDGDLQDVLEVIPQCREIPRRFRCGVCEKGAKERAVDAAVVLLPILADDGKPFSWIRPSAQLVNKALRRVSKCEMIPLRIAGTSLMAVLESTGQGR